MSNLIPFALRVSDNQYVEVSEVSRGKKCNCICPLCKMPLQARQGEINSWHFAHHSFGYKKVKEECEYSRWVSIIAMAKQAIENMDNINTPEYKKINSTTGVIETITGEKKDEFSVKLNTVKVKPKLEHNIPINAMLEVKGKTRGDIHFIGVIFTYPEMENKQILRTDLEEKNIGILEISLEDFDYWFPEGTKSYKSLKDKIQFDIDIKKWLYHPNEINGKQTPFGEINYREFDKLYNNSKYITLI
ncbi:MAG: hypothetical protein RIT27_2357 [Pseudomonadota bacterium]|jgi:hypothetical protein